MRWLDGLVEQVCGAFQYRAAAAFYRKALCVFVAANTLMLLPVAHRFWGPDALTVPLREAGFVAFRGWNLLATPAIREFWWVFVALLFVALAFGFLGKWVRLSMAAAWLLHVNLTYAALDITNGGYHLTNLLLFACAVIGKPSGQEAESKSQLWANIAANLGWFGARFQLALLYASAGLYKLFGVHWLPGEAMYYILNVEAFMLPWQQQSIAENSWLLVFGTWGAMLYQLSFPVLIWFPKLRWPMLLLGTGMHLFIGVGMGLMDFAAAMIVAYTVFYPEAHARKLLGVFGRKHIAA